MSNPSVRKRKSSTRNETEVPLDYEARPAFLLFATLDRDTPPEVEGDITPTVEYQVNLNVVGEGARRATSICFCSFHVVSRIENVDIFSFKAEYLVGYTSKKKLSASRSKHIFENIVSISAWPRFKELLAVVASQGKAKIPSLPDRPEYKWDEHEK